MADVRDDLIDPWLAATLRADTVLVGLVGQNIYNALAPADLLPGGSLDIAGKATAYVEFDFVTGDDEHITLTTVGSRVQVACRYQIKAVGAGRDSARLRPVLERLNLLHGAEGDLDGHHFICQRAAPVRYLETTDGHHWWHRGGQFDITVHTI